MSDNAWDDHARSWDEDEAPRAYARAAFSSLQQLLKTNGETLRQTRALDFGCGTGLLTEKLVAGGATVHAVDTSPAMLSVLNDKATQRRWTNVTTSPELPRNTSSFDLIVCSSVCSFLEDYPDTVTVLASLLRPNGLFVQWDWERSGDDDHGLSKVEINDALRQAGLVHVGVTTAFSITIDGHEMSPLVGYGQRL